MVPASETLGFWNGLPGALDGDGDNIMERQPYLYETNIQWSEKRRGKLQVEGLPDLLISTPPEFKGEAGFWTPEHLFVAAAEACLMATFLGIAENSRLAVAAYRSSATGKLEWSDGGWRFTEIAIHPVVELENTGDEGMARRVMAKAAANCLIANSIRAAMRVAPNFEGKGFLAA